MFYILCRILCDTLYTVCQKDYCKSTSREAAHRSLIKFTPGINFTISPTFHAKLLHTHTDPKSTKRQSIHQCLLELLVSVHVKAAHKMLMKLTPGVNFINDLHTAFALVDPESVKITVKSSVSFYAFGIYERKSCM
jgi:hypothetical protein